MAKKKTTSGVKAKKPISFNFSGKLSLVIPCFNESKRVSNLIKNLERFDASWGKPYELILVDDGSTDNTAQLLQEAVEKARFKNATVEVIALEKNTGKGGALKAGVAQTTGDYFLTLDADMATSPMQLKNWLAQLPNKTFDENQILIGSREDDSSKVKGQPLRRVAGLIYNFIIQLFTNLNISDTQCGFKLYPAAIGKPLFANLKNQGWSHDIELMYNASLHGTPIVSMPVSWEHQEDSKISLVKDSIRMAWDTSWIALRLTWNWMVVEPIKNLSSRNFSGTEPSVFRLAFVVLSLALFFLMPMLSGDYGITGDEEVQKVYGQKVLAYFETNGEDRSALEYKNLYYYGGMFDYIAAWTHKHVLTSWDVYEMRHFLNAIFGFILILFTGFLAKEVGRSWRMAFFAVLFMALSPRIFGHSMNNPKDIPFAASYAFTLLYLIRFLKNLPRPGVKTLVCLALGIAWAINVRVGGLLLIAYLGLIPIIRLVIKKDGKRVFTSVPQFVKLGLKLLIVIAFGFYGGLQFWPYGLEAPFTNPLKALSEMSNFSTAIRMLFEANHLWSDELPWYYIIKWFLIASPIFLLGGLVLFLGNLVMSWKKIDVLSLLFVAFAAIFPISYSIFKGASLYDGMRHFLFVYPVLVVLAAFGWHHLLKMQDSPALKWGYRGLLAVLVAMPAFWMVKNHPHQYVYFNELSGGTENAYTRYEMDYWMNSVKGLSEWIVANDADVKAGKEIRVVTNCYMPTNYYFKKLAPNVKVSYARYNDRYKHNADYHLFIPRFVDRNLIVNGAYPPKDAVYEEFVDGIAVGTVSKRNTKFDNQGFEAAKIGNHGEAIRLYEQALQVEPNNDAALLGLADAALRSQNMPKMQEATGKLVELSDTYVNGMFTQGIYFFNSGDLANAEKTFARITELNYKFSSSYYYLSAIYGRQNKFVEAVANVEQYDKYGGNQAQAYDLGANAAARTGAKYKELYFKAKKLYHQKDYNNSAQLIQESIALKSDYAPAADLYKAYTGASKQK